MSAEQKKDKKTRPPLLPPKERGAEKGQAKVR